MSPILAGFAYTMLDVICLKMDMDVAEMKVVRQTIEVGTQTATTLKGQVSINRQASPFFCWSRILPTLMSISHQSRTCAAEQMGRIVNELDTIQFSIKKASQLVKEIGRQIMHPNNKSIRDIPGLAPPAPTTRRLLYLKAGETV
ncbi:unnamed protein product [Ilex paraguariensis]|uniref:Vinculin n=1 Tax=Ilex paraguariensis TaxID=185542 RepID=A0ABC8R1E7_9AQUA